MKCCLFCLVSRVSLHFLTSHLNSLSKTPLQRAPTELATWSLLRPWVTNSLPTLMRGFNKFLYRSWQSTPNNLATRSPSCNRTLEGWILWVLNHNGMQIFGVDFGKLPQCRRLQPVPHDPSVWTSCHPCAWQWRWSCRCRPSLLGWSPRCRRLATLSMKKNMFYFQLWWLELNISWQEFNVIFNYYIF